MSAWSGSTATIDAACIGPRAIASVLMETLMDQESLYDTDICTWAEQQAAAIRSLAGRQDLPNQLDVDNLAEEIEDLGKAPLNAVSSLIRQLLVHLVIARTLPHSSSMRHWAGEVSSFHDSMMDNYQPSMRHRIDLQKQWLRALKTAKLKLADYTGVDWVRFENFFKYHQTANFCPIALDEICNEHFDFEAAVINVDRLAKVHP